MKSKGQGGNTMKTTRTIDRNDPSTQNLKEPQQRQMAKEVIAANVKNLIEQLEGGHSDALTAYLTRWADSTTTASGTFWR